MRALDTIVVDGHDGTGKTTLSHGLAGALGGIAVRPFADTLGDHVAWLWRAERYDEAGSLALAAVERVRAVTAARPLVFDRHWLTMFTVLPERHWAAWYPLPPTVVLTAAAPVVASRLAARAEATGDLAEHDEYGRRYLELSRLAPAVLHVETDEVDAAATLRAALAFCASLAVETGDPCRAPS